MVSRPTARSPADWLSRGGEIVDDGATFWLHIDNQVCTAVINPPAIGAVAVADDCGFLRYPAGTDPLVTVAYHAQHPLGRATFGFSVYRGAHHLPTASASGEVTAATAGPYTGDGSGNFSHPFARTQLTFED